MTTSEVMTKHGPMIIPDQDVWIGRSLRELGEHSQCEINFMYLAMGLMTRGAFNSTVIDAGAYIGDLTIPVSRFCKHIYAFEPQAESRAILEENIRINHRENVTVLPYALGEQSNLPLRYKTADARWNENQDSPGSIHMGDDDGTETAEMVSLDSLGLDVDFLKADIEGMEIPMLAGARDTLSRCHSTLFLERDTVILKDYMTLGEVLEVLGYDYYPMSFPMWRPDNHNRAPNTFGSTVAHMMLGVPRCQSLDKGSH